MEPLPRLDLRPNLLAAGVTDRELRRMRRIGLLTTVRPGAYVHVAKQPPKDVIRHRLAVHATAANLAAGSVISHVSAAVMHGLPLWNTPLRRVHATRDRRSGARRNALVHLHAAALAPEEVTAVDGLLVTSVARTLVDLARHLSFEQALVPTDGALFAKRVTRGELAAALERGSRRQGNSAARRVVAFSNGLAESPGESRSRLAIMQAGLPAPTLQHEVVAADGRSIGRTDFWWAEFGTAGEFDGLVKYGRLLQPGQDPGDVVFAEKLREDAMRAEGVRMSRWIWSELRTFSDVATRVRRSFALPR